MNEELKQKIIRQAELIGINKIGFTHADPFYDLEPKLHAQQEKGHHSGFEHKVIEERIYPEKIFDQPKSIIAIALAYPSKMTQKPPRVKGERRGEFARASWGKDYHEILSDKMDQLIAFIRSEAAEDVRFKPMVDTGELVDVAVAQRAGLGFIGRNGLLITEEYGSYVYLGEIITNIPFEADKEVAFGCGDCTRCIDACPTDALLGDGRMNAQRCLSYQTQTKGYMPKEYRRQMGHVIYGCDICQIVCPYNKGVDSHFHEEMEPDPKNTNPELKPLLTISNKDFKQTFGPLAGSWRGKKPIQRNAIIALANYRDFSAVPDLLNVIDNDPRPMIRGTAAWAVATIMKKRPTKDILSFLEEAAGKETDPETVQEFAEAISDLKDRLDSQKS